MDLDASRTLLEVEELLERLGQASQLQQGAVGNQVIGGYRPRSVVIPADLPGPSSFPSDTCRGGMRTGEDSRQRSQESGPQTSASGVQPTGCVMFSTKNTRPAGTSGQRVP